MLHAEACRKVLFLFIGIEQGNYFRYEIVVPVASGLDQPHPHFAGSCKSFVKERLDAKESI
jgi:hypothetical protein